MKLRNTTERLVSFIVPELGAGFITARPNEEIELDVAYAWRAKAHGMVEASASVVPNIEVPSSSDGKTGKATPSFKKDKIIIDSFLEARNFLDQRSKMVLRDIDLGDIDKKSLILLLETAKKLNKDRSLIKGLEERLK